VRFLQVGFAGDPLAGDFVVARQRASYLPADYRPNRDDFSGGVHQR
jgi:hypothetical protein